MHQRHYSGITPFLHLSINDFYNGKPKTVEPIFNNYFSLSDEAKSRLQYHKFLSPHRENCNTKSVSSLNILTNKGISNQYLNCYISASVHLLLGTIICAMLPNLLENDWVLNATFTMLKTNYILRAVAHLLSRNAIEKVLLQKCQCWGKF